MRYSMAKKTALDRIEYHEKICRIMQKETFQRIDRMEMRIARIEKWIIGGLTAILLAVLSGHIS
jgi:cell division protein FtsL